MHCVDVLMHSIIKSFEGENPILYFQPQCDCMARYMNGTPVYLKLWNKPNDYTAAEHASVGLTLWDATRPYPFTYDLLESPSVLCPPLNAT